jgi:hypothetical protein
VKAYSRVRADRAHQRDASPSVMAITSVGAKVWHTVLNCPGRGDDSIFPQERCVSNDPAGDAAEQQAEVNFGTYREPVQLRRTLSRLGSWYGMRGCRLLAVPQIRWCGA